MSKLTMVELQPVLDALESLVATELNGGDVNAALRAALMAVLGVLMQALL